MKTLAPLLSTAIGAVFLAAVPAFAAPESLALREEAAFRAAVAAVAPSVVSIETVGGLDTVGEVLVGTGPSSGVIVTNDGYIVSSTFNFAHRPASIIVSLAGGRRLPAKLIARDEVRKLVLLKVEVNERLPVAAVAPQSEAVVGMWSIAIGRTFEAEVPNTSVGIISAVNRIWGKALQTDAKISPVNYGGPLVDIRGRVLGVLVPLSPTETDDESGAEWYDSGIGFAVPMEHIAGVLPRWKQGTDLKAGLIGIRFRGQNVYADPPLLAHARAGSPAYKAGLRKGDLIRAVGGKPVDLQVQVMEAIQSRYAGDTLRLTVARTDAATKKSETLEREVTLVDHLDPYQRPFLGFLPERNPTKDQTGVGVRFVYDKSPAQEKGLAVGDRITAVGDVPVKRREELAMAVAESEPGKPVTLHVERGDEKLALEITPAKQPETVPELPAAPKAEPDEGAEKSTSLKIAEFGNACALYAPHNYADDVPHGLVILLHPAGGFEKGRLKGLVEAWLPICRRDHLLLLIPSAKAKEGIWAPEDLEFLSKAVDRTAEDYLLDVRRIVTLGYEEGGAFAMRAASRYPERIRAAALLNSGLVGPLPENEPATPLAYYVAAEKGLPNLARVKAGLKQLRDRHFPVTFRELTAGADDLDADQRSELARWIDVLDRI
ncbi:MAG: hypothetical protein C0483_09245 [Pirellula sp.]|nr:hypothetical protein [Pirellula sp.]